MAVPIATAAFAASALALLATAGRAQEAGPKADAAVRKAAMKPRLKRIEDFAPPEEFVMAGKVKTHVITAGDPAGRPVVLIHGFGASTYSWRENIPALAKAGCRVIAYDVKGFGLTEKPKDGRYRMAAYVEQLGDLIDALKLERPALVGNSMGGAIALHYALLHPGRVGALVLVNSSPVGREIRFEPPGGVPLRPTPALVRLLITPKMIERTARTAYLHPERHVTPEMVEVYHRPLQIEGTAEAVIAMMDPPADPDRSLPPLSGLKVPVLVAWGRHDDLFPPEMAQALARRLPDARVVLFDDSAHVPQEEEPAAFNEAVVEFLRQHPPAGLVPNH